MVGSNSSKILTVSYGTFSCTLEGFDDPFSTMRHIAEYFRDLAAEDRYFGAEPPTPDAEMLHRIAEREIQRRVEARVTGESVVLRQLDTGLQEDEDEVSAAEVIAEPPAARSWAGAGDELEPAPAETETARAADHEPIPEARSPELRAGSIEEKLSRIRAVVERTRSRDLGAGLAAAVTEEDDADDEAMVADMSPGFAGDIDATLISQVMAEQAAGDDRMPEDDTPAAPVEVWDFDDDDRPAAGEVRDEDTGGDDDSDAAAASDETVDEDQEPVAEAAPTEDDDAFEGELEDHPGAIGEPEDAEEADDSTEAAIRKLMPQEAEDDRPALAPDEPELHDEAEPEIVLEADAEEDADDRERETADADRRADAGADEDDDAGDMDEELWDVDFDAEARAESASRDDEATDGRELDLESEEDERDESDGLPRDAASLAAARLERPLSKSSQLRAPEVETPRLESRTESAFAEGAGSRRRSAIAHLKAAVAATRADKILSRVVGRDRATDPAEQKDYREDLSMVVKPRPASEPLAPPAEEAQRETSMAMAEAEEDVSDDLELEIGDDDTEEAEAPRRTTSRVKTRLLGPEDTVGIDAYFEAAAAEDEEQEEAEPRSRSTPLMLVSELRVNAGGRDDVRPRRVSREVTAEEAAGGDEGAGFEEFARRMGAHDLTDLMEAAAAYTAFVEGQPHFSRPQIMRRVARVDPTIEDSREAGLRSFGQLLRQGRIQKLQRGQFTVAKDTRFKPAQRFAGE